MIYNKMKKKFLLTVIAIILIISALPISSAAKEAPALSYTTHCAVYNIENNKICFEQNADERMSPSGTVKMMTALLAIEHFGGELEQKITVEGSWLSDVGGHTVGFSAGEVLKARDLLGALLVGSGNDAAYIIANVVSGSTEAFIAKMNEKAAVLGMNDTHYTNPAGTDDEDMYTSVRDTVKISAAVAAISSYTELSSQRSYVIDVTNKSNMRNIYNRNHFVSNYYNTRYVDSSISGLIASSSSKSGWCISTFGRSESGLGYIVVVLGANDPDPETASEEEKNKFFASGYEDSYRMLKWAYENFGYYTILDTSSMVCEVPVKLSSKVDHVILLPTERLVSFLPLDTDSSQIRKEWELTTDELKAPISKGQVVGKLRVFMGDEQIGETELIAKNNVDRSNILMIKDSVVDFLTRPLTIIVIVLVILAAVAYAVLSARYYAKKNRTVRYRDERRK